jgi:hypothetical protein
MTNRRFSRSEILVGAGAATIAGLTGCEHSASSLLPNSGAGAAPFGKVGLPAVTVAGATGAAIQHAIDSLPSGGGTINLTSKDPYVIDKALVIKGKSNVTLMGRGPLATSLVAASGAVLTPPGYSEEYLLLVDSSSNVTVEALTIDTINEANSSGNPRIGIGAVSTNTLNVSTVTFVNNLGPNGFNQGLSINDTSKVTVYRCKVSQQRTGISFYKASGFTVTSCLVELCASQAPSYPGPNAAISIVSSSGGLVTLSQISANKVNAGIYVKDGAGIRVTSNKISQTMGFAGHGNDGVFITDSYGTTKFDRVHVQRCEILHNSGAGIGVMCSSKVNLGECSLVNNGAAGINLNGGTSDTQMHSNHVSHRAGSTVPGIKAGHSSDADNGAFIHDSVVHGFGVGVDLGAHTTDFTVENNDLRFNKKCVSNSGSGNVISENLC